MSKEKIEFLDFAKGYAIFTIVIFHVLQLADLQPLMQKMIFFGGTGVHLFFLLSGYGFGLSRGVFEPMTFYKRRMSKIWLPYVLVLTISLVASYVLNVFPDRWQAWLAGVGLYQMFIEPFVASFGGHFWFISAIMQFYLVYPLIRKGYDAAANRYGTAVLIALAISVVWWAIVYVTGNGDLRIWNSFFLQFLWEFVLGMALASALHDKTMLNVAGLKLRPDFWNVSWWVAGLVGVLFAGVMLVMALKMGAFGKICNDVPALIGYTGICVCVYQLGQRYLPFINRFFMWVSSFSFSLYLVHMLGLRCYLLLLQSMQTETNLLTLLAYLPIALALGRLFEPLSAWWTERVGKVLFSGV